ESFGALVAHLWFGSIRRTDVIITLSCALRNACSRILSEFVGPHTHNIQRTISIRVAVECSGRCANQTESFKEVSGTNASAVVIRLRQSAKKVEALQRATYPATLFSRSLSSIG